jgi:hypothetical protein
MNGRIKTWICIIVVGLMMVMLSQLLFPRSGVVAQQGPNPGPTPDPKPSPETCVACCEMPVGGHTIGGPGRGRTSREFIFLSTTRRNICVTVQNLDTERHFVRLYARAVLTDLDIGVADLIASRFIESGEIATVCDKATAGVQVTCPSLDCDYRWRVDDAQ